MATETQIQSWTVEHNKLTATRIEACLNACAGIPTEQLTEGYVKRLQQTLAIYEEEERERKMADGQFGVGA